VNDDSNSGLLLLKWNSLHKQTDRNRQRLPKTERQADKQAEIDSMAGHRFIGNK